MASHYNYDASSSSSFAPDPYTFDFPKRTVHLLTANERHKWISEAAYFIAERRGFASGHELSDWLEAMASYYSYGALSSSSFAPNPYIPDFPQGTVFYLLTASERHKWVSEAAYFIAERRGFAPGRELSDWLEAEREVNRFTGFTQPD